MLFGKFSRGESTGKSTDRVEYLCSATEKSPKETVMLRYIEMDRCIYVHRTQGLPSDYKLG